MKKLKTLATALAISCCFIGAACTQSESVDVPTEAETAAAAAHKAAVDAAVAKAEEAYGNQEWADAASAYLEVIRLDPGIGDAHRYYPLALQLKFEDELDPELDEEERTEAMEQAREALSKKLLAQYEEWNQSNPDVAGYRWGLGQLYNYKDYDKVEQYTNEALEIDSDFAPALATMALLAEVSGDRKTQAEFLRRAAEANPDDASSAFYYVMSLRFTDRDLYRAKSYEMAERFPDDDRGAQVLYWLAIETDADNEKLAIYDQLLSNYPPGEYRWSASALSSKFELVAATNPHAALQVAETMIGLHASEPDGSFMAKLSADLLAYQQSIVTATDMVDAGQYQAAVDALAVDLEGERDARRRSCERSL